MDISEKIYDSVRKIEIQVAGIDEHLKTLNGNVRRNCEDIKMLETDNINNKVKWAKVGGVSSAITAIIFIAFRLLEMIWTDGLKDIALYDNGSGAVVDMPEAMAKKLMVDGQFDRKFTFTICTDLPELDEKADSGGSHRGLFSFYSIFIQFLQMLFNSFVQFLHILFDF